MKLTQILLFGVAGWCAIGIAGVVVSLFRHRRGEAFKHAISLAVAGGVYLLLVLAVSIVQRQTVVPLGQDQCFDQMCFAAVAVDEIPGLVVGDDARVERVSIRVTNHGHSPAADSQIHAYVIDARGTVSEALPGLSGNRLDTNLAAGSQMLSRPMFRVALNASGLGLVFTHGSWQPRRLLIGDSDSFAHRPTIVPLGR